jgi:purine-nucleoside phosphorylase
MSSVDNGDAYAQAARAADELASFTGFNSYDAALTLGSGWSRAVEGFGTVLASVPAHEILGFRAAAVEGHTGMLQAVELANGKRILVLAGRTHLYEGHGADAVVHGVRVAAASGAKSMVLTNGAGGVRDGLVSGQPMLIADHINLTATSPLRGARFVDLTDLYSSDLRARVRARVDGLTEGIYAQLPGPHYETPAEIRSLRTLGADAVGMSTALEAIAAREVGMQVLGVSLITNMAAGMAGPLDHAEVLAAGHAAVEPLGRLLGVVFEELFA